MLSFRDNGFPDLVCFSVYLLNYFRKLIGMRHRKLPDWHGGFQHQEDQRRKRKNGATKNRMWEFVLYNTHEVGDQRFPKVYNN